MIRLRPGSTRTDTLCPYTTLFRSRGRVSRNKPGFGRVFRVPPTVRATNPGRGRCRSTEWTVDADGKRVPGGASCPPGAQGDGNGTGSGQACVCLRGRRWHPAVAGGDGG